MKTTKQILIGAILLNTMLSAATVAAETIAISCGAVGAELQLCKGAVETWAKQSGHQVKVIATPNSSTERLALYQQLLAAGATDIDIFLIDIIWTGILSNHLIDLKKYSKGAEKAHFPTIIANNTVNDRLVAMPWFTDAGVLYYRKDLLEKYEESVPVTWEALTATAKKIQTAERVAGNTSLWGFVWQGKAYEGLTCNALEWIVSYNGGAVVDSNGKITIDNSAAIAAVDLAATWIKDITPPGVLNYQEEEARGVFQSGNAVFMRNWPYAWALGQSPGSAVKGKMGVTMLPKGGENGRHAATLGGWQLAISQYSKHPEIAADLVMYLTSAEQQKHRAIKGAFNPTIASLYEDKEILAVNPFLGSLYHTFVNAVPRPSAIMGTKYNQASYSFWNAVHEVLSARSDADTSLARLAKKLKRLSRGGKRW